MLINLYQTNKVFPEECRSIMIAAIPFSGRLLLCLQRAEIHTVEDLLNTDISVLEHTPGFGLGCRKELVDLLKSDYLDRFLESLSHENHDAIFIKEHLDTDIAFFAMDQIDELPISENTKEALKDNGFSTIGQVLNMPVRKLEGLRGIGHSGVERILTSLNEFRKTKLFRNFTFRYNKKFGNVSLKEILSIDYTDDFNNEMVSQFIPKRTMNKLQKMFVHERPLVNYSPEELFRIPGFGESSYYDVMNGLMNEAVQKERNQMDYVFTEQTWKTQVEIIISRLSQETLYRTAQDYIDAYRLVNPKWKTRARSSKPLIRFIHSLNADEESNEFVNWLIKNENLVGRYQRALKVICNDNSLNYAVMNLRLACRSLAAIAVRFNLKKEDIRNIESEFCERIIKDINLRLLIANIYLNTLDSSVIYQSDIRNVFKDHFEIIVYCLKHAVQSELQYNLTADLFIISKPKQKISNINKAIASLPDIFAISETDTVLEDLCAKTKFSLYSAKRLIAIRYKTYGNYCTCSEMTNAKMYRIILAKYFEHGIHLYDQQQISAFRNALNVEFDHPSSIPDNDHSLVSGIRRSALLCGRGTYCAKSDEPYLPTDLESRIENYIEKKRYLVIKAVFSKFQDELHECNIDNYYHLLGVLKEIFGSKFFFRKDYIGTSNRFTGIYDAIVAYIKRSKSPVSKEEILHRFPGTTSMMIQLAVNDSDILNLFGKYIHADQMNFRPVDIEYFKNVIETMLKKKNVLSCRVLYDYISSDHQSVLNRYGAFHSFSLFSILQYLFNDEFQFARPWIARFGVEINKPLDIVRDYLESSEIVSIPEMVRIADSLNYRFSGIQRFIDSFNTTHLMINRFELQSIESLNVSEKTAKEIEETLNVEGTMRIDDVLWQVDWQGAKLPANEWLLYSLLKKWGTEYEVTTVNPYKTSIPVIYEKGKLNLSSIDTTMRNESSTGDEDIDDLIADLILEELDDEL